jgi:hypothetical protein
MFNGASSIKWVVKPKGIALGAGLAAAMLFLYNFNPAGTSLYPPCPFNTLSGLYCPGCGSLRALHQLSHGHLFAALSLNPLMIISLPFVLYGLLSEAVSAGRGRILPTVFVPRAWIWLLFGVIVIYWVARNIPVYPFLLLAPH